MRRLGLLACALCLIAAASQAPQKTPSSPPAEPATPSKKQPAKKAPTPAQKPVTAPKKPATAAKKPAAGAKKPASKAAKRTSSGKKSKSKSRKRVPSWRTGQQAPTRERYLEIQGALIARGYLEGPATGVWGPECLAALKKFQADQNLEPTGKLDSLSLIALGLGPKREGTELPPPVPPGQVPPSSEPKQP